MKREDIEKIVNKFHKGVLWLLSDGMPTPKHDEVLTYHQTINALLALQEQRDKELVGKIGRLKIVLKHEYEDDDPEIQAINSYNSGLYDAIAIIQKKEQHDK